MTAVLHSASFALIAIAVVVALIRMARGPSMLDRAISMDVISAAAIAAVATYSAMTGRLDLIPALVALSLVGFLGTTAIARFAVIDDPEEARIMTEHESAQLGNADYSVHDVDSAKERP